MECRPSLAKAHAATWWLLIAQALVAKVLRLSPVNYHLHIQLYLTLGLDNGPVRSRNFAEIWSQPIKRKESHTTPLRTLLHIIRRAAIMENVCNLSEKVTVRS